MCTYIYFFRYTGMYMIFKIVLIFFIHSQILHIEKREFRAFIYAINTQKCQKPHALERYTISILAYINPTKTIILCLLQLWKPWETKQNSPGHENKGELLGRWKKKREREHRDKKDYDIIHTY